MAVDQPQLVLDDRRRLASPSERRCIARQDLGHQRALVNATIYTSKTYNEALALKHGKQPFFAVLKSCIEQHPISSTVILRADTESPEIATPSTLGLDKHLEIRDAYDGPEERCIEKLMAEIGDETFSSLHTTPPWKVVLVSLASKGDSTRLLVLYSNYHSHGDGRSGLAFQDSFHARLLGSLAQASGGFEPIGPTCNAPKIPLLPPIEEGGRLTLSWSYLLSPLIGTYLPAPVASFFGIRSSWLAHEANIWRGKKTFFDPANHATGLVLVTIEAPTLSKVLQHCRAKHATFTGLLEHLVTRSLVASDGGAVPHRAFNTGIAIDMRHLFGSLYSGGSMLNCVTGYSELVMIDDLSSTENEPHWANDPASNLWQAARKTSASLKVASSTLHDQPIGLLQYLKKIYAWTAGQMGKEREMSYEVSNLGAFTPTAARKETVEPEIGIERVFFSQPAKAAGSLLDINPVSLQGGSLSLTVTWQQGVLDLPEGEIETNFVRKVCSKLESMIREIAAVPL